ncbi:MAG TPA: bis(5'-nucleosyl)-tetraphosphatase (symmetrical) YqeK [Pseudothermotoga sp.]|nr:bis(5'-nucleosyl)-tetraphosphatase (symmetrical) YqeK [Pseudothermotoga sp.]
MNKILEELQRISKLLLGSERLSHVESCVNFAVQLARIHGIDEDRVVLAAFAHDIFRDVKPTVLLTMATVYRMRITELEKLNPILLHGKVAAEYIKRRFALHDRDILDAIAYHTSGKDHFSDIGKIVFLSDSLEENRIYDNVDWLREMSKEDLNEALFLTAGNKIQYAIRRGLFILPETVKMWNWLVKLRREDYKWN